MAKLVQAVARYGPRVVSPRAVRDGELYEWLAGRTGLNRSQVAAVLYELSAAISFFNRAGMTLRLAGVGIFKPSIRNSGRLRIRYFMAPELRREMNATGAFGGEVVNRENIGVDPAGYKALWDAEFPDDPLDLPT